MERTADRPVSAGVGDVRSIDLPEDSCDGTRTERVLIHLTPDEAEAAISELVRVVRPEGRISLVETCQDQCRIDGDDVLPPSVAEVVANPTMGLHLRAALLAAGCAEVASEPRPSEFREPSHLVSCLVMHADAEALIERYVGFICGEGDSRFEELLAEDFFDHVSGRRGSGIWAQVAAWSRASFADPEVDVHEVMTRGDRVIVWMTVTATHVGSGFPRLRDIAVTQKRVPWAQVHIFHVSDGRITEHWAVRDDYAMVEAIIGSGPLTGPPHGDM